MADQMPPETPNAKEPVPQDQPEIPEEAASSSLPEGAEDSVSESESHPEVTAGEDQTPEIIEEEEELIPSIVEEAPPQALPEEPSRNKYLRFTLYQRLEHFIFLLSFTLLGFTGLPQKYATTGLGQGILAALGGIENARLIHHIAATVMMVVSIYHVNEVLYKLFVERTPFSMLPGIQDIQHVLHDIQYNLGFRKHRAYYGRYSYAEKAEYLALVWGTIIMGLTGFMMWNPITTASVLPGQAIPAAKAAHGAEAILAVLAIILWHFYHVHIRQFNKSMFIGTLTHEEMEHEHPAELAEISSRVNQSKPSAAEIQKRQKIFYPFAAILTLVMGFGVVRFLTVENTAITTVPKGETAAVFLQITPTPRPTPTPTPTPVPVEPSATTAPGESQPQPGSAQAESPATWEDYFSAVFKNRCDTCHGNTKVGGLSIRNYQDALTGGSSGPAIVPGDPDNSKLVQIQSAGGHPGQLTEDELEKVINWIKAGAPEK